MEKVKSIFESEVIIDKNIISFNIYSQDLDNNQNQTKDIFADKWQQVEQFKDVEELYSFQRDWFLSLYGFDSEDAFRSFLSDKEFIIDAGCGLGYKAAWFAELAPHAIVVGIDISDAVFLAAKNFANLKNIYFVQGDIAKTEIRSGVIDFTVCDQVIMHTENPDLTFAHLASVTKSGGEFACYVYRKKALPREMIDDYFRTKTHSIPNDVMWEFSKQLTELGKNLSNLKVSFNCPDIPVLGIKGGEYDVQRFIYWNFLKCFWKDEWSFELNQSTNYDWYAPSNARRFSKEEFVELANVNNLKVSSFHEEEACYSARFLK